MPDNSDRDQLVGMMAFQLGWVDRETLVNAFRALTQAGDVRIEDKLMELGVLSPPQRMILASWVEQQPFVASGDTPAPLATPTPQEIETLRRDLSHPGLVPPDHEHDRSAEFGETVVPRMEQNAQEGVGIGSEDSYATMVPSFDGASTLLPADAQTRFARVGAGGSEQAIPAWQDPRLAPHRYRVLKPLAEGGLGEVLVANDEELNRQVALKQIRVRLADNVAARQRFLLEAEVTGSLEHPGIVPVYGLGVYPDGRPYYAMRLIRGESLREACQKYHATSSDTRERSLALRKLLDRFVDVCQTMEYAHSRGVLHRDLKPDNIMLGPYGETLVVDWGLAKMAGRDDEPAGDSVQWQPSAGSGSAPTRMGTIIGTPAYMSPEQASGQIDALGPASDIYALGATLYYVLCGKTPLESATQQPKEDIAAFLHRVSCGDFRPAHQIDTRVPRPLSAICQKAMESEVADRYVSAQSLADDITRFLADEPVAAFADPWPTRVRRWAKRHQTAATTSIALVLATTIGLAAFSSVLGAKQKQLEETNDRLEVAIGKATTAAELAETRRQAADDAKANELAFSNFLVDNILATARPLGQAGGLGIDVKVVDALRTAETEIDKVFKDRPLAEATARSGLGGTWQLLGDYERSVEHYRRSCEIIKAQLGEDDPEYIAGLSSLALSLKGNGQINEAIELQERVLQDLQRIAGLRDAKTLIALNNLALSYADAHGVARAIPMLEKSLELTTEMFGAEAPQTLNSLDNLASVLRYGDEVQRARADQLYQNVVPLKRKVLGEMHPETLSAINNMATLALDRGESDRAIRLLEETIDRMTEYVGANHAITLTTEANLAYAYATAGNYERAIELLEETVRRSIVQLTEEHPNTLNSMDILAVTHDNAGNVDRAIELYRRVVEGRERVLGPNHSETLTTKNNLALALHNTGRSKEAVGLLQAILDYRRQHLPIEHPLVRVSMNNLAAALVEAGEIEQACELYTELLEVVKTAGDPEERWRVRNNLAGAVVRIGDPARAVELFKEQLAEITPDLPNADALLETTEQGLAVSSIEAKQYEQARELLESAVKRQRERVAATPDLPTRSLLRGLLIYLGQAQLGLGDYEGAEASARESDEIAQEVMPGDWRQDNARGLLGASLLGQDRIDEAAKYLEDSHRGLLAKQELIPVAVRRGFLRDSFDRVIELAQRREQMAEVERLQAEKEAVLGAIP